MTKGNGKAESTARFDKRIGQFRACAKEIELAEIRHKQDMAGLYALKLKLQGVLLQMLEEAGAESIKTELGTVYIHESSSASCSDPDVFMNYVMKNGAFELLDRRPNGTACKEFCAETGALPPGVRLNTKRTANVRAPTP